MQMVTCGSEYFTGHCTWISNAGTFNRFHRAMTRPFFARDRVTDFDLFDRHAEVVLTRLKERFAKGEAIDFQVCARELYLVALIPVRAGPYVEVRVRYPRRPGLLTFYDRFTLDSAAEFLFGCNIYSLDAPLPYGHNAARRETATKPHSSDRFSKAFGQAQRQIALRSRFGSAWPLFEFWKDKTQDAMRDIYDFVDPILKNALEKRDRDGKTSSKCEDDNRSETLLDHLVEETAGE